MARNYPDWIQAYLEYTKFSEAPTKFHFWTAVATLAGALRRHVWIDQLYFQWIPNFYIIFVSPPGIVKKSSTADIGISLLRRVPGIKLGPNAITWQALTKALGESTEMFELPNDAGGLAQSAITILASELGSLLDMKDRAMIDVMTDLWDGKKGAWEKKTKTSGDDYIANPFVNIIGCTTPAWMRDNFTRHSIGGGFTARIIFVHGQSLRHLIAYPAEYFTEQFNDQADKLVADLERIAQLIGPYAIEPKALEWGKTWYTDLHKRYGSVSPTDEGLLHFLARKQTMMHKLAMVIAASRREELVITLQDLQFCDKMLSTVEADLPEIFGRLGERDEVKDAVDVVTVVTTARKISKQALMQRLFNRMNVQQFELALTSAVASGYVRVVPEGNQLYVYAKEAAQTTPQDGSDLFS